MIILLASLGLSAFLLAGHVRADQATPVPTAVLSQRSSPAPAFLLPVYHIPLRVHLGKSGRSPDAFRPMLQEINEIWLFQAGICFEMEVVMSDEGSQSGMDLWFMPALPEGQELNGYYRDDHTIQVRDTPRLGPAGQPARFPAARTAAHELGHGLDLPHRQDSDDNLMRSKTYGWQLDSAEIARARAAAKVKSLEDRSEQECGAVGHTVSVH